MSNKQEDSDDPFLEHKIAYTIEKDYKEVMRSKTLEDFQIGLQYKSPKTAEKDLKAFDLITSRMKAYKEGWIKSNALQTAKLLQAHEYLQWEVGEFQKALEMFNEMINSYIKIIKKHIPEDKLNELRELELQLRKLKKDA